ncbi:alpha-methylacyl-CoA racemase-like [Dendronephthya gigantea]|uniref:alpha-methylacyl-CoA racemase-like n=1 Tax=Dendronephthya gigantea TaxID=151771 RepID=UPI00106946EB|nr:alpha-methylacyl-CoA racemase-like [Dendronephthya gigantea]
MAALQGVKVLEFAGLAPVPYAGMILADFGASVTRIDRVKQTGLEVMDRLGRGKRSAAIDLRSAKGVEIVKRLSQNSDVLIEPFRPGVMEKLGLGPEILMKDNPRLIYARVTGFGQQGPLSTMSGHDINYAGISGTLSMIGRRGEKPIPPLNILADFAGGGLMCDLGIMMALFERNKSGKGQVVDASMVNGVAYLSSFVHKTSEVGLWSGERGTNLLDSGAPFYDTYLTADGQYVAVGALEAKFFKILLKELSLEEEFPNQLDMSDWPKMRKRFSEIFRSKTRQEWSDIFDGKDACVTPVLGLSEATKHPHNLANDAFLQNSDGTCEPTPAPKLSRTPGKPRDTEQPKPGQHTREVLQECGYSLASICELEESGVIYCGKLKSSL